MARFLVVLMLAGGTRMIGAQTPADTAAVILDVARNLERQGRAEAARELFRYLHSRYGTTPAARTADSLLRALPSVAGIGTGRTGFVTFNTLYGGFLGVAVAGALNAQGSEAYGVGLLVGAPAGFFVSRAFARKHFRSSGQAGMASFATIWGTWQGLGLQQILTSDCVNGCSSSHDAAPWRAMVAGGLAGIGVGWAIAATKEIRPGTASLISHSAFWGTWYGLAVGEMANLSDDGLLSATLIAGNVALLAAIPAAKSWRPTSSRIQLITAGGLAGGLAGFGIDLIAKPDDDRVVSAIPAATSALGLLVGALTTRNQRDLDSPERSEGPAAALVTWREGLRFSPVAPEPARFQVVDPRGGSRWVLGTRLRLFDASF